MDDTAAAGTGSVAEESQLWARWRGVRDLAAREELVARHLPYARTVAATYYGRRVHDEIEFGDYLQYARVGLLESLDRFDPAVGVQFKTFAARRMHGAILDGIERLTEKQQQIAVRQRLRRDRVDSLARAPASEPTAVTSRHEGEDLFRYLADVGIGLAICRLLEGTGMVDNTSVSVEARGVEAQYAPVEMAQLQRRLLQFVDGLGVQQRTVIRYHYLQEHSFEDIAAMLSLTRGRISQIHRQALMNLRARLSPDAVCDVSW